MSVTLITVIERPKIEAINGHHRLSQEHHQDALRHAFECGRLLAEVKADLAYGEWLPWVDEHFEGSERSAQIYMRIAANPQRAADLRSIREAERQLSRPRPVKVLPAPEPDPEPAALTETTGLLLELGSRIAPKKAELALVTEAIWDEDSLKKAARILTSLGRLVRQLEDATGDGLSREAVKGLLRTAERDARELVGDISRLAFSFQ